MNRTGSFDSDDDNSSLQDLETIALMTLAHNFTPRLSASLLSDHESMADNLIIPSLLPSLPQEEDHQEEEEDVFVDSDRDAAAANVLGTMSNDRKRPFTPTQAADVVDSVLGDFHWITPPSSPTPERPAKKARKVRRKPKKILQAADPSSDSEEEDEPAAKPRPITTRPAAKATTRRPKTGASSCSLPTADDPIDESHIATLYSPRDEGRINPAHCVIRRQVLEVRRTHSGRVLFQCACCKHLPRNQRAKLSTLAPQSVDNLYRAMVRFMMNHVKACPYVPEEIKGLSPKDSRVVTQRGTKKYWVKSAKRMGLRDGEDGKSIVFCEPATADC